MKQIGMWGWYIGCLLGVLTFSGCAVTNSHSTGTLPSSAFFVSEPAELKALQAIAKTQEGRLKNCSKATPVCEDAYYTKGLVALFENRADAINVFQELHTTMPNGRHSASSLRWLYLLQDSSRTSPYHTAILAQLRQEVLHTLLAREDQSAVRRVKEQERKVAELN